MADDEILTLIGEAFKFAAPEQAAVTEVLAIDNTLEEIGISSITALEMAGYIEDKLATQFPDDELAQISTLSGFVKLIRRHLLTTTQTTH